MKGVDASKVDDALFKKEKKSNKDKEGKFFAEASKVIITILKINRKKKFQKRDLKLRSL